MENRLAHLEAACAEQDQYLKTRFHNGMSWYDIITDSLEKDAAGAKPDAPGAGSARQADDVGA